MSLKEEDAKAWQITRAAASLFADAMTVHGAAE
jgi:hypothetical protein